MNVMLKPELEKFVAEKVKAGQYADASAMVNEALGVLMEQEEFTPEQTAHFRRDVGRGLEQLANGQCSSFEAEKIIAEERARPNLV